MGQSRGLEWAERGLEWGREAYRNEAEWGIDSLGNRAIWWFTIWLELDIGYIGYIYI